MLFVSHVEESARVLSGAESARSVPTVPTEEEISLLDLSIEVVRKWRFLIKATLGAALIGLIASLLWPSLYTATIVILPPQQSSSSGSALLAQLSGSLGSVASLAGGGLGGLKNPNDLQVALLKSRTVEDAMLDRFHLPALYHKKYRSDARKKFESRVNIDSGTKDGLIRISVTDRDAQRAADLANGYVEEFKKQSATLAVTEASQRRLFFEQQLEQSKNNLATAEEDLKKTEQKTGMIQLDSQARAVIELVAQLHAQIAAKEVQIQGMRSFGTNENSDIQMAEQELAGLQAQQRKMGAVGGDEVSSGVLIPKGNLQQAGLEYVRKSRDVKYYETIFSLLARQYEAAKVDEARQGAVVQVVDAAIVPDKRSWPLRTYFVFGAAILGMMLSVVWILSRERLADIRAHLRSANTAYRKHD
ncbi:MAG: GNVR domain-containing protein [Granulicella sp.]